MTFRLKTAFSFASKTAEIETCQWIAHQGEGPTPGCRAVGGGAFPVAIVRLERSSTRAADAETGAGDRWKNGSTPQGRAGSL